MALSLGFREEKVLEIPETFLFPSSLKSVDFGSAAENGLAGFDEMSGGGLLATGAAFLGIGFNGELTVGVGLPDLVDVDAGDKFELVSSSRDTDVAAKIPPTDRAKRELAATPNKTF